MKAASSTRVKMPIESVFIFVSRLQNDSLYIPNLSEYTDIEPEDPGVGQRFNWRFNMLGRELRGTGEVTAYEPPRRIRVETKGDVGSVWEYSFREMKGGTEVGVEIDYELSGNFFGRLLDTMLVSRINQNSAEQMMVNLKTLLESGQVELD